MSDLFSGPPHNAVNKKNNRDPCQILGMLKVPLEHRDQVIPPGADRHGSQGSKDGKGPTRPKKKNRILQIIRDRCVRVWATVYAQ